MGNRISKKDIGVTSVIILIIVVLEYVFFHNVIGTSACLGDTCDGRLTALIAEHWYQFFVGKDGLTEVNGMFFPAENILSYSDILLGVGIIHSVLRFVGVGIFTSYKYSLITIHLMGSIGLYFYLHFLKKINVIPAFFGVVCFSYSHIMLSQAVNTQLLCVNALVLELIFLHYFIHSDSKKVRYVNIVLIALFMALQFYTAYYVAFMGALQLIIVSLVYIITFFIKDREYIYSLFGRWKEFLACIVIFGLSMIPFIALYLPTFKSRKGLDYDEVYVTHLNNLFYNGFDKTSDIAIKEYNDNYSVTTYPEFYPIVSTVILVLLVVACFFVYLKKKRKESNNKINLIVFLLISVCIVFALGIDIGGFSLWKVVYYVVPGAKVIRAQLRWELIRALLTSILFAFCADYIINSLNDKVRYINTVVLIAIITIVWYDNFELEGAVSAYDAEDSEEFISYVEAPPTDCTVFYIKNGEPKLGNTYIYSVAPLIPPWNKIDLDAVYISAYYNLETINGYSGGVPTNWNLQSIESFDTDSQAISWLRENDVASDGIYSYDMKRNIWEKVNY